MQCNKYLVIAKNLFLVCIKIISTPFLQLTCLTFRAQAESLIGKLHPDNIAGTFPSPHFMNELKSPFHLMRKVTEFQSFIRIHIDHRLSFTGATEITITHRAAADQKCGIRTKSMFCISQRYQKSTRLLLVLILSRFNATGALKPLFSGNRLQCARTAASFKYRFVKHVTFLLLSAAGMAFCVVVCP